MEQRIGLCYQEVEYSRKKMDHQRPKVVPERVVLVGHQVALGNTVQMTGWPLKMRKRCLATMIMGGGPTNQQGNRDFNSRLRRQRPTKRLRRIMLKYP